MKRSLPIFLTLGEIGEQVHNAPEGLRQQTSPSLCQAMLTDLLQRCAALPGVQAKVCTAYGAGPESSVCAPLDIGALRASLPHGLIIAVDVPTLPIGYLHAAVTAIRDGQCAWVGGETLAGHWYLWGWGTGGGRTTIPLWYRIHEPGGLERAQRDLRTGSHAPETARVLDHAPGAVRTRVGRGMRT
ncbi:MAG TPA: hypothetical protein VGL77_08805 [Armatimonadota bacterium]